MTDTTFEQFFESHKNKTVRELWELLKQEAAPLAEIQAEVKAASPPTVPELDKDLAESDDPKVMEFRAEIERLETALRNAREDAHGYIKDTKYKVLSSDELEALNTKYAQQATRVRKSVGMLRDYGEIQRVDGVVENIDKYRIPNLRGNATRGRTNLENGGPRPKIESCTIVREDQKAKTGHQISVLAPWAKLTSADIYAAWFAKAGVSAWQDIHETHTFDVGTCTVTIVPKASEIEE